MTEYGRYLISRIENGESVTVIGIGISNVPLIEFLLRHNAKISARDKKSIDELGEPAQKLAQCGVKLICGDNYLSGIDEKIIFRSPGIRPDTAEIADAVKNGSLLTSEMELFFELTPSKIIGITGSDGKTTTTTLIYKMLELENINNAKTNIYVGGNIGKPLLPLVDEMTEDDICVVELSSFQLQSMTHAPDISVITNIAPNHLNWHTGMDEYISAKSNIISSGCKRAVLNYDNEITRELGENFDGELIYHSRHINCENIPVSQKNKFVYLRNGDVVIRFESGEEKILFKKSSVKLPGEHNLENYMSAVSAVYDLVSAETIDKIARTFGGVEHRLEFVREINGVKFINGSIDSSPTRTKAALSALVNEKGIVIICGGSDKHIPFEPLADALIDNGNVKAAVLTGETADKIYNAIENVINERKLEVTPFTIIRTPDFSDAVKKAADFSESGDTVLLSPACASFDSFKNFEQRGNFFKKIVNEMRE